MFFQNPTKEEIVGLIIKVFPTIGEPVTEMQLLQLFQGIQKLRFLKEQRGGYLNDSDLAREARRIFGSSAPQVNSSFWSLYYKVINMAPDAFLTLVTPSLFGDNAKLKSLSTHHPALFAKKMIEAYQRMVCPQSLYQHVS